MAIHCILHCRGVYPQGVFGRRKKYNVPVQVNFYETLGIEMGISLFSGNPAIKIFCNSLCGSFMYSFLIGFCFAVC